MENLPGFGAPGDIFVVQWDKVRLRDRETEGAFTFQTVLCHNGTIVFGYKDVSQILQFIWLSLTKIK